jgi:hypothetical protein
MAGGGVSLAAGGGSGAAATDVAGGSGGIIAEAWLVSAAAAAARDWVARDSQSWCSPSTEEDNRNVGEPQSLMRRSSRNHIDRRVGTTE